MRLAWLLAGLRVLSRLVDGDRLAVARVGAEVFALRGAELTRFCRRAWWAAKAGEVLRARVERRPAEVRELIVGLDLSPIARAARAGRGVIMAGAHIGPEALASALVYDAFPDTLFLFRGEAREGHMRVLSVDVPEQRRVALVAARAQLKKGGLVYVSPDGASISEPTFVPLRGGRVPIGRGVAALARLTGAPAYPVATAWTGGRISFLVGDALRPRAAAADDWELEWLTAYVTWVDRWSSSAPENVFLHGSVYERLVSSARAC